MNGNPYKVFISYAHDSREHKEFILQYSNQLINPGGLDCWIDQYVEDAHIPEGWPNWMRKKIKEANFVLVVCSPAYIARYEQDPSQNGKGLGAKFESTLILQDFYEQGSVSQKFIPVVVDPAHTTLIMDILKGQTYYDLSSDARKLSLYRKITNQPLVVRPQISPTIMELSGVPSTEVGDDSSSPAGITTVPDEITEQINNIVQMKPGTKILQAFFALPVTTRFAIARTLGLVKEGESLDSPNLDKLSATFLERAYNEKVLGKLWSQLFDESLDPNPFKT